MSSTGASGTPHGGNGTVLVVLVVVVVGTVGAGGTHAAATSVVAPSSVVAATTFDRRRARLNSLVRGSIASPFVCEDPTGTSHREAATTASGRDASGAVARSELTFRSPRRM
jgi:hypothetical protein